MYIEMTAGEYISKVCTGVYSGKELIDDGSHLYEVIDEWVVKDNLTPKSVSVKLVMPSLQLRIGKSYVGHCELVHAFIALLINGTTIGDLITKLIHDYFDVILTGNAHRGVIALFDYIVASLIQIDYYYHGNKRLIGRH